MTCSASMWLSRSLFSFIYEVIFILRDKESAACVYCTSYNTFFHMTNETDQSLTNNQTFRAIRLWQAKTKPQRNFVFFLPVFCLSYILDQAIKCCDSLNPSPPLPFPSPKLKQSSCWWDRRLWAVPLPLKPPN